VVAGEASSNNIQPVVDTQALLGEYRVILHALFTDFPATFEAVNFQVSKHVHPTINPNHVM